MSVYIRIHTCVVGRAVCEVEVGGRKRGESKKNSKTKRDSTQRQRAGDDIRHAPRPRVMRGESEGWGGGVNPDRFFFF